MKGATTEPCANINKPPIISITKIIGANHNFLRALKKDHNSIINSIITIPN
jgi:hypothetical protein